MHLTAQQFNTWQISNQIRKTLGKTIYKEVLQIVVKHESCNFISFENYSYHSKKVLC